MLVAPPLDPPVWRRVAGRFCRYGSSQIQVPELDVTDLAFLLSVYIEGLSSRPCSSDLRDTLSISGETGVELMIQKAAGPGHRFPTAPLEPPCGRGVNFQHLVEDVDAMHGRAVEAGAEFGMPLEKRWNRVDVAENSGQLTTTVPFEAGNRQFVLADPTAICGVRLATSVCSPPEPEPRCRAEVQTGRGERIKSACAHSLSPVVGSRTSRAASTRSERGCHAWAMSDPPPHTSGTHCRACPPLAVLRAWRVQDIEPLPGGGDDAFRSEHLVLKPAPDYERSSWLADTLDGLMPGSTVRIIRPVRSVDGTWVVDGWAAWHWVDGDPWQPTLHELLDVSESFHGAVARVPWAPEMRGRDGWAVADRIAWGEEDYPFAGSLKLLDNARLPVQLPHQLIHGDLYGNVLSHPALGPAVIDVSPYWRPAAYADAIIRVDHGIEVQRLEALEPKLLSPQDRQLLIRAVLFRTLSEPNPTNDYDFLIEHLLKQE